MIYLVTQYLLQGLQKSLTFSKIYILLDLLIIISTIFFYFNFGFTAILLINTLLLFYLLVISITDFKYQIIPDKITYLYIIIGMAFFLLSDQLDMYDALIGMIVGVLLFMSISVVGTYIFKKPAMGGGDIKLAAMLGIFIGWEGIFLSLFIASLIALIFVFVYLLIFKKKISTIPFGPFLVLSAILIFLNKMQIIDQIIVILSF